MIDVEPGDVLQAIGVVQRYKEAWELIVEDLKAIRVIEKWSDNCYPIWQLAQAPTKYLGLNVNVSGFVDGFYDSYFSLVDLEDKYSLVVFYGSFVNVSFFAGKEVCVLGQFFFDEQNLRYGLILYDETHGVFPVGVE